MALQKPAEAAFPGANGKLVFVSRQDGDADIYTVNPEGSSRTKLVGSPVEDYSSSWSSDGAKIIFMHEPQYVVCNDDVCPNGFSTL